MTRVQICIELSEAVHRAYQREAERRGVTVEELVEKTVNTLLEEVAREEEEGTDHPVIPA